MPDFAHRGTTVLATTIIQCLLPCPFLIARCYARKRNNYIGWDDYTLIFGWLVFVTGGIIIAMAVGQGYGHHADTFPQSHYAQIVKTEIISQTFAVVAFIPIRAGFVGTVLRVFNGGHYPGLSAFLWFCIITNTILFALVAILDFAQCDPPSRLWDRTVPGTCWNPEVYTVFALFTAVWSAMLDFALTIIPWYYVAHLRMSRRVKFGIASGLSLGVLAGGCGLAKIAELKNLSSRTDYAYDTIGIVLWASTEQALLIIAASIPIVRPLVVEFGTGLNARLLKSLHYGDDTDLGDVTTTGITRTIEVRHDTQIGRLEDDDEHVEELWPMPAKMLDSHVEALGSK